MSRAQPSQSCLWDAALVLDPPSASRPTEAAYWRGSRASRAKQRDEQRHLGQFMTPPPIARFIARGMAGRLGQSSDALRVLDPAAGSGVLAAAFVEVVASMPAPPKRIELLLCDLDPEMQPLLLRCVDELAEFCVRHGVHLNAHVHVDDFLLSPLALERQPVVDAVIGNPPYFKLGRRDPRALAHDAAVHGQPNIYALFMSACAALLRPGGAFGFITPRSWTNGAYFRATRECLRRYMSIDALHLFDSRQAHFEGDAILQEALIVWGTAARAQSDVRVSVSHGSNDLESTPQAVYPAATIMAADSSSAIVLPSQSGEDLSQRWPSRLADLGFKVLTGPVVGFRAAAHLRSRGGSATVPMLWMPHVRRGAVAWPRGHRSEHIERNPSSEWMLLPNEPMVLMRRFSPKEDLRRITATAYVGDLPGTRIGCENHLNVVRGTDESMSIAAAVGLAGWLNSALVDDYLRQRLGSTQVNAVELRDLPVPALGQLETLGQRLAAQPGLDAVDAAVAALRNKVATEAHAA